METAFESADCSDDLPYLTADVPAVPGAIKRRYEDFCVDEIPAYEPSGRGDHVYFTIEKTGLTTMQAVRDIARALNARPGDIGLAGLKDARGVTRQTLSLEHAAPDRVAGLNIPRIKVLNVTRHTNKLRIGHLRGNRFIIRLRETTPDRLGDVRSVLSILQSRGAPNYFGQQRFGSRGDTWAIGRALLCGEAETVVRLMCGTPHATDTGDVLRARQLFDAGDYAAASAAWPGMFRECRRVCRVMAETGGNFRRAIGSVDRKLRQFFVSAFQSRLFNRVLTERIDEIDRVRAGDIAWKHDNGALFSVENAEVEQPRAARFEISPTGPLFGHRMTDPTGEPREIEDRVLRLSSVEREEFVRPGPYSPRGDRRSLRFRPAETAVEHGRDEDGEWVELRFGLPPGCYATAVLREICKDRLSEGRLSE
jgi:tRNA pseudouridine13 synthase